MGGARDLLDRRDVTMLNGLLIGHAHSHSIAAAPELLQIAIDRREPGAVQVVLDTLLRKCDVGTRERREHESRRRRR